MLAYKDAASSPLYRALLLLTRAVLRHMPLLEECLAEGLDLQSLDLDLAIDHRVPDLDRLASGEKLSFDLIEGSGGELRGKVRDLLLRSWVLA